MPLPSWIRLSTGVPARADLAAVSTPLADVLANVAAENAPLRIVYGRAQVGAQIANVLVHGGRLIVQAVWCEGEIDAVESVSINNEALPAGVTATHYTGTAGQTVNATLAAAFAAQGIVYADALPGIAYSVVSIPARHSAGFPDLVATIRGRKVFDTRTSTVAWSDNPALCLADFIASPAYGLGLPVDAASVTAVANDNDALVGGLKRRRIGLVIDGVAPTRQHIEALRAYAGCWVIDSGAGIQLVSDRPRATDHTVTAADVIAGTFRLRQLGVADLPTVVHVLWTDTTTTPWSEKTATAYAAGVVEGLTPRRESTVPLLGIQTYAQALREATERVNHFSLENIEAEWEAFDQALAYEKGDVASVTNAKTGLSAKQMRITDVKPIGPGRFRVAAREYDAAAYSDAIASEPSTPDTSLPNPAAPPKPTGVTAVEEVYQMQNGTWASRIKLTWNATEFAYLRDYRVEIYANGDLIETATPREAVYRTGPVKEGTQYTCKVAVISAIGATSEWEQGLITPLGKSLVPSDVPSVSAFEAGGTVFGQCAEATDIDILRYKWKYWPVGGSWATGTLIDKADSLRCTTSQIPVGTWVLGVKAVDSIQQESVNAATCPITVSSDTAAFFVNKYDSANPTLTNMAEYSLGRDPTKRYFVTEDDVAWDTKFSSEMDTYTNPLSSYHNSVTSTWEGEGEDFGQLLGGQWTSAATVAAINGTIASYMGFSTADSGYTFYSGLSHKQNARWAKLKHEATGTATLSVTIPEQNIRLDAIHHEETHSGTSSAANPVTVHLDNEYVATKDITITPISSTPVLCAPDNIGLDAPNPADRHVNITISSTYTTAISVGNAWGYVRGRHSLPTTGKWYWEVAVNAVGTNKHLMVGVCSRTASLSDTHANVASTLYFSANGYKYTGGDTSAYGARWTTGDVIGVAYDADAGTITFYKNGASQGQITGLTGEKFMAVGHYDTDSMVTLRIDKSHFSYTPPTGFNALPYAYDVNIADTSNARVARSFMTTFKGV